jgi:ubiquinone biosynthesis UbiH/UbiF/VisC/COQ6 family hydroxylase
MGAIINPVDYDLIVVGAGPVGASLAAAARSLRGVLLAHERRTPRAAPEGVFDSRVYALSPGNVEFLRGLGVWARLAPGRLAPVHAMRVFGDDGASALELDAYRAGVPEIAWIVEDAALQDALWAALDVEVLAPAECEALEVLPEKALLKLRGGRALSARLVAGADGANSFVRGAAGIGATERDYGQAAVVANFRCEKPQPGTAWQWFQGGPVLALLPLPGDQVSMVWSLPAAQAARIARLEAAALCAEVELASRRALGTLALAAPPRTYPLRRLSAARLVAPRVALLGDAGHVIHPLAGQGLNLGLQDARSLAATLTGRGVARDPGELGLLRRYERVRAEPILAMDAVVGGLFDLFGAQSAVIARMRNAGLNLTDRLPVLKNILIRHAMG